MRKEVILTDENKCVGCNKCIVKCPVDANDAKFIDGKNKVTINHERCIQCGECLRICDHQARTYIDDTQSLFEALDNGEQISVIAAPAIRNNFPNYKKLFGYLKQRGVNLIYDVSFGADITTWAYLKAIEERQLSSVIAQPCPVIVSYIECYKPELIPYLAPIHSPALCTAIYIHKYKQNGDKIAFLSPCIGKVMEFEDENTHDEVNYNVTYAKLSEYLQNNRVNLMSMPDVDFDDIPCGLGLTFSRPGGLRENVEYYTNGEAWIKQVENIHHVCDYFNEYLKRANSGKPTPLLVDVLNCANGCNVGTATENNVDIDEIDYRTNILKKQVLKKNPKPEHHPLFKYFNEELTLEDFIRKYSDHSRKNVFTQAENIEEVFIQLGKEREEDRNINCHACGYGDCGKFAQAVANSHNHVENCIYYARNKLTHSLKEFDFLFDSLKLKLDTINGSLDEFKESSANLDHISKLTKIISINASIESARAGASGKAFAVVASEIKKLAEESENVIKSTMNNEKGIEAEIENLGKSILEIREKMHGAME